MDPNSQVLLSIGIPTITVLIGMLVANRHNDATRREIASLDDKLDTRFNALQDMMNSRFATVDERIHALQNIMNARFDAAHESLLRVEGILDARLSRLEERRH